MECPICFAEYDSSDRKPLRAFCACKKTICLSCVESMLKNAAFCPWDKTRWFGRNLMAKFESNTPPNYLKILLKQAADHQTQEILDQIPRCVELGAGELRNEYLRQQRLEQERHQAELDEITRKDEELVAKMESEAQETAAMLLRIEQEDMKLALSMSNDQPLLQTSHASPSLGGLVKDKSTILYSINKQLVEKIKHPEVMDLSQSPITARNAFSSATKSASLRSEDSSDGWISARSGSSSTTAPSSSSSSSGSGSKHVDIKNHFTVTDKADMSLFANRSLFNAGISSQSSSSSSSIKKTQVSSGSLSTGGKKDVSQYFQKRHNSPQQLSDRLTSSSVFSGSQNVAPNNSNSSDGIAASKRPRVIEAIELISDESDTSNLAPPKTKRASSLRITDDTESVTEVPWFCSGCTFRNGVGTTTCRMCKADRVIVG